MNLNMPTLPRNPRIKKAELVFTQYAYEHAYNSAYLEYPNFGLYHVTEEICAGNCTPIENSNLIDYAKMKVCSSDDSG